MADQLTFEELLNKKRQAGFDEFMAKDKLNKRIEERNSFKEKNQREKSERKQKGVKAIGDGKKEPKAKYSKLPVSAIKREYQKTLPSNQARDPRFMDSAGSLNQGLFQKSYSFIKDVQADRMRTLYENVKQAKRVKDETRVAQIQEMISEEKQFMAKQRGNE